MPFALITALLVVAADTADTTRRWEAYVSASAETFARSADERLPWELQMAGVRRRGRKLSVDVAGFSSRRFGVRDKGGVVEVTRVLWTGAYGSVRVHDAPEARAIARLDASVDLYQGVGRGWEALAGARSMRFEDASVAVYGGGLAKYVGHWYLRGRASVAPMRGEIGIGGAFTARRYFSGTTNLLELSAGTGREVVTLAPPNAELRRTSSVALRGQRVLTGWLGATATVSYADDEGIPARRGLAVGMFGRW